MEPYIPEPYLDRGGDAARNKPIVLSDVLGEKAEFLDAKQEKSVEQGKSSKKVSGKAQFVKVWKSLFDQTQTLFDGEQPYATLVSRLPHIDILNMTVLALAEYLRYFYKIRLVDEYDQQTNTSLIQKLNESLSDIYKTYEQNFVTWKTYLKPVKAGKSTKSKTAAAVSPEEQFKDVYRYMIMLCNMDQAWKKSYEEERQQELERQMVFQQKEIDEEQRQIQEFDRQERIRRAKEKE